MMLVERVLAKCFCFSEYRQPHTWPMRLQYVQLYIHGSPPPDVPTKLSSQPTSTPCDPPATLVLTLSRLVNRLPISMVLRVETILDKIEIQVFAIFSLCVVLLRKLLTRRTSDEGQNG